MKDSANTEGKCPFRGTRIGGAYGDGPTINDEYPGRLRVEVLSQHSEKSNPMDPDFNYAEEFKKLDLDAVKKDIFEMLETSQPFWPADYGHYGPQMIRMAWHAAGTYRIADGRGGAAQAMQRFAPLSSWEDNGNIDKSRRLLWPIKKKYGKAISWADLMILTGNCALESMGLKTFGFGGGRVDAWEPDVGIYWGPEAEDGGVERWDGDPSGEYYDLENPLGASQSHLIYVNPEGPAKSNNPMESAREIRETFARMAMNDEETVALIAGGHAFGKSHGAVPADKVGVPPEQAPIHAQAMGWMNEEGTGFAEYAMTNGIEGSWTPNPTKWDNDYLTNLFKYDWEQTKSPAGATQWKPKDSGAPKTPDAHIDGQMNELMMMTSDIALKEDPIYREICQKFLNDFDYFTDAFSRAWYKLVHRDMGPKVRYLGKEVPEEELSWQDPLPARDYEMIGDADVSSLKGKIADSGLSVSELVSVAWGSASTFRNSDKRGGANGARIRLAPQKDWEVNNPKQLAKVLEVYEGIKSDFDTDAKKVSIADLIVLGGVVGVEKAAKDAGVSVDVPFTPGRVDARDEDTDVESFEWLHPVSDGFRNFQKRKYNAKPESMLLDRANLLMLTPPELTALVGGLRVLGTNWDNSQDGVFTDKVGVLTNDFFVNLYDMTYVWSPVDADEMKFEGKHRDTGEVVYTATRCDLIFGHAAQLRAVGEVYASDDGHEKFVRDFVKAWVKVMDADRFDLAA